MVIVITLGVIKLSAQCFFSESPKESELKITVKSKGSNLPLVVNYSYEFPVPLNQGNTGTCVAHALAHYFTAKAYEKYAWSLSDSNHIFSPMFWYNSLHQHGSSAGLFISQALYYASQYGDCFLRDFKCVPENDGLIPTENDYCQALKYRLNSTSVWSAKLEVLKRYLANNGPCLGTVFYNGGSWGHCFCIVGYNDTIKVAGSIGAVLYINSYGPNWSGGSGENSAGGGYGWIPYNYIPVNSANKDWYQFYFLGNPIARDPDLLLKFPDHNLENISYARTSWAHYSFVKSQDQDTIKKINYVQCSGSNQSLEFGSIYNPSNFFYLPVDTLSADSLILKAYCEGHTIPARIGNPNINLQHYALKLDSCWKFDFSDNKFLALNFEVVINNSLSTSSWQDFAVKDSISILSDSVIKSSLLAKISLGTIASAIKSVSLVREYLVYPNPAKDFISIENRITPAIINIYDINGQKVFEDAKSSTKLDISRLPAGIYLIRITTKNKILTTKLVKI